MEEQLDAQTNVTETSYIEELRQSIEDQYQNHPTGCGGSFGELLCHEIHSRGLTFNWLAAKWGISLPTLGELIYDHCKRLENLPRVNHDCTLGHTPSWS